MQHMTLTQKQTILILDCTTTAHKSSLKIVYWNSQLILYIGSYSQRFVPAITNRNILLQSQLTHELYTYTWQHSPSIIDMQNLHANLKISQIINLRLKSYRHKQTITILL